MALLILMRHGQSMWNAANLFTGWVDVPLTNKGIEEAISGGKEIATLPIDEVHVSTLIRAQMTAMLALAQHDSGKTPIFQYSASGDSMSENESRMNEWSQSNDSGENKVSTSKKPVTCMAMNKYTSGADHLILLRQMENLWS
jgi:bisphosphoglycerate-dependent phosphoglycerate mutase